MEIKKEMKVGKILREYPETVKVFSKYGLKCAGCPMSEPENLEEAAMVHGLNLKDFLKELNNTIKENAKTQ